MPDEGNIHLKWTGFDMGVREVTRAELGVFPESEEVLTWDASNRFISPIGLTEEEVQVLAQSGGGWAIIEDYPEPDQEAREPVEIPTESMPEVAGEQPKIELPVEQMPVEVKEGDEVQLPTEVFEPESVDQSASDQA